jgi:hypothetical protein
MVTGCRLPRGEGDLGGGGGGGVFYKTMGVS